MTNLIHRLVTRTRRLLLAAAPPEPRPAKRPAPHPATGLATVPAPADRTAGRPWRVSPAADERGFLRGEDTALVRPYLLADERAEARTQRGLWLAADAAADPRDVRLAGAVAG